MRIVLSATCLITIAAAALARAQSSPLTVGNAERLLVVAPHPDDETLGAGGLIQRVLARSGSVCVALVTAGDGYVEAVVHETGQLQPHPVAYIAYGKRRLVEARAVLKVLGGDRLRLEFLGFPDGGLLGLLRTHWYHTHPEHSQTTGAADPPYADATEPDVPYTGADLRRELIRILRTFAPTLVALPDPLDKHPDHRATGLFTLLAVDDWIAADTPSRAPLPRLLAYLVHWPGWPLGSDARPPIAGGNGTLELPLGFRPQASERVFLALTDSEVATKRTALSLYATQQEVMPSLLAMFVRGTEPFTILHQTEMRSVEAMIEHPVRKNEPTPRR